MNLVKRKRKFENEFDPDAPDSPDHIRESGHVEDGEYIPVSSPSSPVTNQNKVNVLPAVTRISSDVESPISPASRRLSVATPPLFAERPEEVQPEIPNAHQIAKQGRSTLSRPTTKRGNAPKERVLNKKMVRQQMAELRGVQAKLQKRIVKQSKIHQREKEAMVENYKRLVEQSLKNQDAQKKNLEKLHKQEHDDLSKTQIREQKGRVKAKETEDRKIQHELRDQHKTSLKNHLNDQRLLAKQQRTEVKESKKTHSKSELKFLENEHRVELKRNDTFHSSLLARQQLAIDLKSEWDHGTSDDRCAMNDLIQAHKHNQELLRQAHDAEYENLDHLFVIRREELGKLLPLELRQLKDRQDLEMDNLKQQLQVEYAQQMKLLLIDQRKQLKDFQMQLRKEGKTDDRPGLIKSRKLPWKASLNRQQLARSEVFENDLAKQRALEEEQLAAFQQRQIMILQETHAEQLANLEKYHINQRSELNHEELQTRTVTRNEQHASFRELLDRHAQEQTDLLDAQHQAKMLLMRAQQKKAQALIESQRQELLGFIQSKQSQITQLALERFTKEIHQHFDDAVEQLQKTNQAAQHLLSDLMESEQKNLKNSQAQATKALTELQKEHFHQLKHMAKLYLGEIPGPS